VNQVRSEFSVLTWHSYFARSLEGVTAVEAAVVVEAAGPSWTNAAKAAWPRLMPPSLGGTERFVQIAMPLPRIRSRMSESRSSFWNTPPDKTTVSMTKS